VSGEHSGTRRERGAGSSRSTGRVDRLDVVVGLALAVVVMGPGLRPGPLLNLDLLVTPEIPVPNGIWGLGPALSQRVPMFALFGLGSALVGGPLTMKAFFLVGLTAGFVGMSRLVASIGSEPTSQPPSAASATSPSPSAPSTASASSPSSNPSASPTASRRPSAPLPSVVSPPAVAASPGSGLATDRLGRCAAAGLWVAGPFLVTRLAVGHVQFVWLVALLPWLLPALLRPSRHLRATFVALVALAFGGPATGTLGLVVVAVGLVAERLPSRAAPTSQAPSAATSASRAEPAAPSEPTPTSAPVPTVPGSGGVTPGSVAVAPGPGEGASGGSRPVAVVGLAGAASLLWIAPTLVLLWAGAQVAGSGRFATQADGVDGWLALLGGGGFWSPTRQIGGSGAGMALGSLVLVGLALAGRRRLGDLGRPLVLVGAVGLVLTAASAVPGVRGAYDGLSGLPIGAPLRESQRFLVLWLAWLAPAAAAGAPVVADLVRRRLRGWGGRSTAGLVQAVRAVPLVVVVLLSVGGWWGMQGVFRPVTFPDGWAQVRDAVRAEPGPTVALPWNEYPPLDLIDGRHAFNPLPDYLGGDVISSYDPLFDPSTPSQEQVDRRAWHLDAALRTAGPLGPAVTEVGARWVVVVHQPGWEPVDQRLAAEPAAFEPVIRNRDATLWRVRSWRAPVVGPDGSGHDLDRPLQPFLRTDAPGGSVVGVAGAPGWVQGWFRPVGVTEAGLLELPDGGSGPVWFWPAPVLVLLDAVVLVAAATAARRHAHDLR